MTGRIVFANQLRGIAALSVAISHLVGAFWGMRDYIGLATFAPPPVGDPPLIFAVASQPWFNFGPFGVGLFFLISGLVVPISLQKHTAGSFLLARALRIFPTYLAAMAIELIVLYAAARYWGKPFGYGPTAIVGNLVLVYDLIGQPSIDLVNWTLCVELKFYVLIAVIASAIRRGDVSSVLGVAGLALAGNQLLSMGLVGDPGPDVSTLSFNLSAQSVSIVFMLIGVAFNFHLRGLIGGFRLALAVVALSGLFALVWRLSVLRDQFPIVTVNYFYALALFAMLYLARAWITGNRLLDAMAAISYPFYLVHAMLGYSIMKVMMIVADLPYAIALPAALASGMCVAAFLHMAIERPSIRWGRYLARRDTASVVQGDRKISAAG